MGIRLDEAPPRKNTYLITLISTLDRLFLGLHPFWEEKPHPCNSRGESETVSLAA